MRKLSAHLLRSKSPRQRMSYQTIFLWKLTPRMLFPLSISMNSSDLVLNQMLDLRAMNHVDRTSNGLTRELMMMPSRPTPSLFRKDRHGEFGSREYLRDFDAATVFLDPKMVVPLHFVSSHDGETESGNETGARYIQEVSVSNHDKLIQAML